MASVHGPVIRLLTTLTSHRLVLSALFACAALAGPAQADERQNETVPELNAYFNLSDRFRLFTSASLTKSLTEGTTDGDFGAYLDLLAITPIGEQLFHIDLARNRYWWGRIGYAIGNIREGRSLEDGYSEAQFVAELSGRYPISPGFWLLTRARIDLRTLSGERSNRYRVRLGMEKEFTVFGTELIPYARAEFRYDTRFDAWNSQVYQVGVDIELSERFRIEPYYALQIDTAVEPTHLDRLGLVLKYFR
jgi:hypothetical protein